MHTDTDVLLVSDSDNDKDSKLIKVIRKKILVKHSQRQNTMN